MADGLERPIIATDVVVFCIHEGNLMVLTYIRDHEPFAGAPALPGVAVLPDELIVSAARRALKEKTGNSIMIGEEALFLEQLATFDGLYRDPRGRTISVAYMGLIRDKPEMSVRVKLLKALELTNGALPFDHVEIVMTAVERLRGKLKYTNIAQCFLPENVRIEEIQEVYEAILKIHLNRTNFRNKLLKIGMIEQVSILTEAVGKQGGRPPHVYRFTRDLIDIADRDFL